MNEQAERYENQISLLEFDIRRMTVALKQASFCLRELLPNDADAVMTIQMINASLMPSLIIGNRVAVINSYRREESNLKENRRISDDK